MIALRMEEAFERFDRENPEVYRLLLRFAYEIRSIGRDRFGIDLLWSRVRWEYLTRDTTEPYKLNNNHRAFYARKIMAEHPEFAGFFETRAQR